MSKKPTYKFAISFGSAYSEPIYRNTIESGIKFMQKRVEPMLRNAKDKQFVVINVFERVPVPSPEYDVGFLPYASKAFRISINNYGSTTVREERPV